MPAALDEDLQGGLLNRLRSLEDENHASQFQQQHQQIKSINSNGSFPRYDEGTLRSGKAFDVCNDLTNTPQSYKNRMKHGHSNLARSMSTPLATPHSLLCARKSGNTEAFSARYERGLPAFHSWSGAPPTEAATDALRGRALLLHGLSGTLPVSPRGSKGSESRLWRTHSAVSSKSRVLPSDDLWTHYEVDGNDRSLSLKKYTSKDIDDEDGHSQREEQLTDFDTLSSEISRKLPISFRLKRKDDFGEATSSDAIDSDALSLSGSDADLSSHDSNDIKQGQQEEERNDRLPSIRTYPWNLFNKKLLWSPLPLPLSALSSRPLSLPLPMLPKEQIKQWRHAIKAFARSELTLEEVKDMLIYHLNRDLVGPEEKAIEELYEEESRSVAEEKHIGYHPALANERPPSSQPCASCNKRVGLRARICYFCRQPFCLDCIPIRQQVSPRMHSRKKLCGDCFYAIVGIALSRFEPETMGGSEKMLYDYELANDAVRLAGSSYLKELPEELFGYKILAQFAANNGTCCFIAENEEYIAIVFRGTASLQNVVIDLQTKMSYFPTAFSREHNIKMHTGFMKAYGSIRMAVICAMANLRACPERSTKRILVTGHSLGAALASICAWDLRTCLVAEMNGVIEYNFGEPRVGNEEWAISHDTFVPTCYRIANLGDPITSLPLQISGFRHCGTLVQYTLTKQHLEDCLPIAEEQMAIFPHTSSLESSGSSSSTLFGTDSTSGNNLITSTHSENNHDRSTEEQEEPDAEKGQSSHSLPERNSIVMLKNKLRKHKRKGRGRDGKGIWAQDSGEVFDSKDSLLRRNFRRVVQKVGRLLAVSHHVSYIGIRFPDDMMPLFSILKPRENIETRVETAMHDFLERHDNLRKLKSKGTGFLNLHMRKSNGLVG